MTEPRTAADHGWHQAPGAPHIIRGLAATPDDGTPRDVAHRILDGTATHHDILGMVDTDHVGHYWHTHGPGRDDMSAESKDYAEEEEHLKRWHGYAEPDDTHIPGAVGVLMVGHRPHGWNPDDNPDDGLMGNSYLPDNSHIHLHELHYSPDGGRTWHQTPVPHGTMVHTDGPARTATAFFRSAATRPAFGPPPEGDLGPQAHFENKRQANEDHWRENLPGIKAIHRGIAVTLPKEIHDDVHDSNLSPDHRAKLLLNHLADRPLGMHWSSDLKESTGFARRGKRDAADTAVVIHAATPELEHVETDPHRLAEGAVFSHDSLSGEREVPLKENAPVKITGVTWYGGPRNRKTTASVWGHTHTANQHGIDNEGHPVELDPIDGWQHADGSVSHDDGTTISDHPVRTATGFFSTAARQPDETMHVDDIARMHSEYGNDQHGNPITMGHIAQWSADQMATDRYEPEHLHALVRDVRQRGIEHPIHLWKKPNGTPFVKDGTHRYWAAVKAGLSHVPVRWSPDYVSDEQGLDDHEGWRPSHAATAFFRQAAAAPYDAPDSEGASDERAHDRQPGSAAGDPGARRHPAPPPPGQPQRAAGPGRRQAAAEVERHPELQGDLDRLGGGARHVQDTIDALHRGDGGVSTYPLSHPLEGWHAAITSGGHQVVHRRDGDTKTLHVGYAGHNIADAETRLGSASTGSALPVEFHNAAEKDFDKLHPEVQDKVLDTVDRLSRGESHPHDHALTGALSGWRASRADFLNRVTHRYEDEDGNATHPGKAARLFIGHIGPHNYDDAIKRLTTRQREALAATAAAQDHSEGIMVAFIPPRGIAEQLAHEGGQPADDLHVTLAYLGKRSDYTPDQLKTLPELVRSWALRQKPVTLRVGGVGKFSNHAEDQHVLLATMDIPGGAQLHADLADFLTRRGYRLPSEHGWLPHMTLAYVDRHTRFMPQLPEHRWSTDTVHVHVGPDRHRARLGRSTVPTGDNTP